jgi:hypothetical protein
MFFTYKKTGDETGVRSYEKTARHEGRCGKGEKSEVVGKHSSSLDSTFYRIDADLERE